MFESDEFQGGKVTDTREKWAGISMGAALLAATLAVALSLGVAQISTKKARADQRPNIVFIFADDLNELTYERAMPKVQRLIQARGVTYENATYGHPLCCPSRVSIQRGQYPHNTGIYHNLEPEGGWEGFQSRRLGADTYATRLDAVGYRNVYLGRYLNGYDPDPGQTRYPVPDGWDHWFSGHTLAEDYVINGRVKAPPGYKDRLFDDVVTERALDQIEAASAAGGPFQMTLSYFAPHTPSEYGGGYNDMYTEAQLPKMWQVNEKDMSDKPEHMRTRLIEGQTLQELTEHHRKRLRSARYLDDRVSEVIAKLRTTGELENTYLFFYSDNGYHVGEHRRMNNPKGENTAHGAKSLPYIEDARFPIFVSGPGINEGITREAMVQNVDLRPTFEDIANATTPAYVDGRSFLSNATGTKPFPRRYAYAERPVKENPHSRLPTWRAVYLPGATFHRWETGEREFYDLSDDPYQMRSDLLDRRVPQMEAALDRMATCQGAECRR